VTNIDFDIEIINDNNFEKTEFFSASLSSSAVSQSSRIIMNQSKVLITIIDDDNNTGKL